MTRGCAACDWTGVIDGDFCRVCPAPGSRHEKRERRRMRHVGFARGRYVGPISALRGHTALLQPGRRPDEFRAQFDDLKKHGRHETDLAFGWHPFPARAFKLRATPSMTAPHGAGQSAL